MTTVPASLDYSNKDFTALQKRLRDLATSVFPGIDLDDGGLDVLLLDLFAHVGDVVTYYQDRQAGESRILTATQRKNILGLIKLLSYEAASNAPATVSVAFTLAAPPAGSVTFPAGTIVSTADVTAPIEFQLLAALAIAAGANPATASATVENSETKTEVAASTDAPNQEFLLASSPFLDATLAVTAADGAYTEVDNFLASTSASRHFTVVVDQNDRALVRFGNGTNGAIPVGTITFVYRIGGGAAGNVEANTVTKIPGTFTDSLGNVVRVSVTNALKASGGKARESIEEIRINAPPSIRTNSRSVAREDFEINARRVLGVARALMLTKNEDATIAENAGILYIIPNGGGAPTQTLLDLVLSTLKATFPPTLTFNLSVQAAVYKTVNVRAVVFLKSGANATTVKTAITAALTAFFAVSNTDGTPNTNVDFGFNVKDDDGDAASELAWSDVLNLVRDTTGVRKISDDDDGFQLNSLSDDVALAVREFPVLGTITLVNGGTGLPL